MALPLIIPDLDIWLRVFDRAAPDARCVNAFREKTLSRQLVLLAWLRQGLLARCADDRQAQRLRSALAGFGNLPSTVADQDAAAARVRHLRSQGQGCGAWQARVWALAERTQALIWSQDRLWQPLIAHGCPVRAMV